MNFKDISPEELIKHQNKLAVRVNRKQPLHAIIPQSDKNPAKYIRGGAVINPKLPGQALPPSMDLFERVNYKPSRDNPQTNVRPGADDHKRLRSRGF